jgi:hypothetical protein
MHRRTKPDFLTSIDLWPAFLALMLMQNMGFLYLEKSKSQETTVHLFTVRYYAFLGTRSATIGGRGLD